MVRCVKFSAPSVFLTRRDPCEMISAYAALSTWAELLARLVSVRLILTEDSKRCLPIDPLPVDKF